LDRIVSVAQAPRMLGVAFLLLPYAALLVGLDVAARYGELTDQHLPVQFFLSQDGSFGEYFEYALMLAMACLLLAMGVDQRKPFFVGFAFLFVVLTADNALQIHEALGAQLAPLLPEFSIIAAHHIGEILVFAAIAAIWAFAVFASLLAADPESLRDAAILSSLVFAIAVFGVVFDAFTAMEGHSQAAIQIFAFLEDGGEFVMIMVSFFIICGMFERDKALGLDLEVVSPIKA